MVTHPATFLTLHKPLGLALIGAGIFAVGKHIPAINKLIEENIVRLVAIYSRSKESAEKAASHCISKDVQVFHGDQTALEQMLNLPEVEAVDIALPIMMLPAMIELAFAKGKHVISDFESGKVLCDLYRQRYEKSLKWSVAENMRYTPSFMKSGGIGKVLGFNFEYRGIIAQTNQYFNTEWRKTPSYQGGFLLDGGVHYASIIRLVLGDAKRISSTVTQVHEHLPPADSAFAWVELESGVRGLVSISFAMSSQATTCPPTLTIYGSAGLMKVTRSDLVVQAFTMPTEFEIGPIRDEIAAFVSSLQRGEPDCNTPSEALRDVCFVQAILESASTGNAIVLENGLLLEQRKQ